MNQDATLCASCGRFSVASAAAPPRASAGADAPIDRANAAICRWEAGSAIVQRLRQGIELPTLHIPPVVRFTIGGLILAFGVGLLALWLGPRDIFNTAHLGVAAVTVGLAIISGKRIFKAPANLEREGAAPAHHPAIRFLGLDSNLLALQVLAAIHLAERAYWQDVDEARAAAVVVIAAAVALYPSRVRLAPLLLAGAATAYAVVITSAMSQFAFRVRMDQAHLEEPRLPVPLWLIFWIVAVVAVFPQLQLLRWGRFRLGGMRGDVVMDRSGNPVLLAFGSAILIAAAVTTFFAVMNGWNWIDQMLR